MLILLTALILSQATPTVIVDPTFQSSKVTTTASGAKRGLDTICLNCSASSGGGDGGFTTVVQGPASDGGVDWPVRAKIWDGADTAQVTATSGGALQVECVGGTCGSAAPFVDNSAFTFGTTSIGNAGAVVDDVATNVVAENSAGAPRMTVQRGLHANLRNAAGTEVGSAGSPLRVDPTGGTTQPVSGTVTTAPPANATTNVAQFGGTNVATGTGVGGAGIPRVTLSSDSSLAANQSVNTAQVNGVAVNVGTGAAGTGTQRVAVASDSAITANAGTNLNTSALALSATQTDRTQKSQITDGTRDGTVKAASTAAIATDTSLVVGLSPNSPLPAGTAVIGHVIADTGSTTAVTGNVTVVQPTGTNLHAVLDATSTTAVTQATAANLNATVVGTKTNNNAAPGATNMGAMGAIANAAAPSFTEGNLVLNSVDLSGRQRTDVSSWLGSTAPTVGKKVAASSIPVTVDSDTLVQINIVDVSASVPVMSTDGLMNREGLGVSVTGASSTCLAADASRQGCTVCLDIDATANVHVRYSSSAATTSYQKLVPGQCLGCTWNNRVYLGALTCIAASGTQTVYTADID